MSIPNYRVVLSFDAERKVFAARAPELEHCTGEGATRGEAINKLEKEIEAQLQNMQERGHRPPGAVDETTYSGEIAAKVSRTLHRDLAWQARQEGIELDQLLSEILAAGLDGRRHLSRGPRGNRASHEGGVHENAGNQRDHRDSRGSGYGSRYHGILDDRANFIEYVRGLDNNNNSNDARGGRPGAPRNDRPDRGGGDRGGGDRDSRGPGGRRRRGGRGHGGPPNQNAQPGQNRNQPGGGPQQGAPQGDRDSRSAAVPPSGDTGGSGREPGGQ
jgi:predicted HicB family RNase H-like nuclease